MFSTFSNQSLSQHASLSLQFLYPFCLSFLPWVFWSALCHFGEVLFILCIHTCLRESFVPNPKFSKTVSEAHTLLNCQNCEILFLKACIVACWWSMPYETCHVLRPKFLAIFHSNWIGIHSLLNSIKSYVYLLLWEFLVLSILQVTLTLSCHLGVCRNQSYFLTGTWPN